MKCKHCKHTIMMAGGKYFHIENKFAIICSICGCQLPEPETDEK